MEGLAAHTTSDHAHIASCMKVSTSRVLAFESELLSLHLRAVSRAQVLFWGAYSEGLASFFCFSAEVPFLYEDHSSIFMNLNLVGHRPRVLVASLHTACNHFCLCKGGVCQLQILSTKGLWQYNTKRVSTRCTFHATQCH